MKIGLLWTITKPTIRLPSGPKITSVLEASKNDDLVENIGIRTFF